MTFLFRGLSSKLSINILGVPTFQSYCKLELSKKKMRRRKMVMLVVVSGWGLHKCSKFYCFCYYIYGDHLQPGNEHVECDDDDQRSR